MRIVSKRGKFQCAFAPGTPKSGSSARGRTMHAAETQGTSGTEESRVPLEVHFGWLEANEKKRRGTSPAPP